MSWMQFILVWRDWWAISHSALKNRRWLPSPLPFHPTAATVVPIITISNVFYSFYSWYDVNLSCVLLQFILYPVNSISINLYFTRLQTIAIPCKPIAIALLSLYPWPNESIYFFISFILSRPHPCNYIEGLGGWTEGSCVRCEFECAPLYILFVLNSRKKWE